MTTFSAVVTTGIYCRPGCGAKPLAENVRTFELAAAAEAAGFRACLRCRPYRVAGPVSPQSPELVCRAVRLIIEGVLDDGTEAGLGARLAVSPRHLRRLFSDHLGVTPDQLARSRRAHFARRLLDESDLTLADVAFASGFGSLRQFNREMRAVFLASPRELRARRRRADRLAADGGLAMRLPCQPPYDWDAVVAFLAERAVPGVESVADRVYRRTISLDGSAGVLEVHPGCPDRLVLRAHLPYWEGLIHVVARAGRMVGVDADVPGAWGPLEVAVHAVVAQDRDPADARAHMGKLVRQCGQPVPGLTNGLTHLFPSADVLATADTDAPVRALAAAVAAGDVVLDAGVGRTDLVTSLTAIPGISPRAAHQVAARLGHRPSAS
jgi:AraC family transcriptional regulator of adaptative response / DNA-3-methyladenine glycosylase II